MAARLAKKVLLIGWDAADWQMIRPLLDKGWMPALQRMISEGVSGNLATIQPALSPMLWNSIATGKRADKHGIHGFVEPNPDRSGIRPVTSTSRKCKAIWNILSQNGMKSNVVSWFASHPAEPIHGAIVTDRFVASISEKCGDIPPGTFHPQRLRQPLSELLLRPTQLDAQALLPFVPRAAQIDQQKDDRLIKLAGLIARASSVQAAACRLITDEPWDFSAVYFSAIDEFGHFFMPYHPPKLDGVSERDASIYGEVMTGCYRFHDMMLDALLAYAGPETTVILVSDHGFLNDERRPGPSAWEHPERWHRSFGIACARGPGIRRGEPLYGATLLDVTPTILAMFGLPIGADMDGRPWLEIYEKPPRAARIASWEDERGEAGMHPPDMREDPEDSAEAIRRLVELGYIDAPDADTEETLRKVARDRTTNLAIALSNSRRAAAAVALWEKLADENPEREGYLIQLAMTLIRLGRNSDGRNVLERMSEDARRSPYVQVMLATIALAEDDPGSALSLAREALRQAPSEPSIINRAADIFIRLDRWPDAEDAFRKSLEILGDNSAAHDGLAQVYLARDEPQQAVEHSLQAVGLTHFFPAAHFHLAEGLHRCNKDWEALAAYDTCQKMGYNPEQVRRRKTEIYGARGHTARGTVPPQSETDIP